MLYHDNEFEFVAVLSRRVEVGRQANALGHMTAGLAGKMMNMSAAEFTFYHCADGPGTAPETSPLISRYPFVVLSAKNSNQLRTLRQALDAQGLVTNCFYGQMLAESHEAQLQQTLAATDQELVYLGVATFGPKSIIDPFVRKFSLYSGQAVDR